MANFATTFLRIGQQFVVTAFPHMRPTAGMALCEICHSKLYLWYVIFNYGNAGIFINCS